jgi:anhydro-N-acetylmuramic acid kinase
MASLDIKDALATLIAIISEIIYIKVKKYNLKKIIITGGGRKNQVLVKSLQNRLATKVLVAENIDLHGDSLEAEAFGYLAVRSILGKPYTFKNTTGVSKSSSGGVLYYYKG